MEEKLYEIALGTRFNHIAEIRKELKAKILKDINDWFEIVGGGIMYKENIKI